MSAVLFRFRVRSVANRWRMPATVAALVWLVACGGSSTPSPSGAAGAGGGKTGQGGGGGPVCVAQGQTCSDSAPCCRPLICAGVCSMGVSDRRLKENVTPIEADRILQTLAALPITTWSYKSESSHARHIGPMAQDFKQAFDFGDGDTTIMQVDADGVAFAAIQALNQRLSSLEKENTRLRERVARLQRCKIK